MPRFDLPYGTTTIHFNLPDLLSVDYLEPTPCPAITNIDQAIRQALDHPIGAKQLNAHQKVKTIAIAINDKTRPVPHNILLPHLISKLEALGFSKKNIKFYIASGTHRPMPPEEYALVLPEQLLKKYPVIAHDCDNSTFLNLGETSRNTPIEINADFANADVKIVVGNIEPHHFMGYSGGVKSAAIGLASRKTINKNHAMITDPNARSGLFDTNPMRQDIEEIGHKINIQYAFNTVLNQQKEIVNVLFGDPFTVINEAIPFVNKIYEVQVECPYDMLIVSPGGHPKDINLYQSQKAITHAASITKDTGWVILLAACPEGPGSAGYEAFIKGKASQQEILDVFSETPFTVGPHKAFQIARDAVRVQLVLISEMPPQQVKGLLLTPSTVPLLNQLLDFIVNRLPDNARIAVMPMGTSTMPRIITSRGELI